MNYEKIYKDAMETALYFVECGHITMKQAIEMFPQLAEYKDEIIRKQILELVRKHSVNSDRCMMEDWLGRHKEQNLVEWNEEDIEAFVKSYSDSLPMCGEFQSYHDALVHAYRQGVVNTLKSFSPSQKLSEGQIYTLERICSNLHLRASDDALKLDEIIKLLKQK